jgi:hypothetical protein
MAKIAAGNGTLASFSTMTNWPRRSTPPSATAGIPEKLNSGEGTSASWSTTRALS